MVVLAQGLRANYEDNVTLKAEFDKRPTNDQVNMRFDQVDKKIADERAYVDAQVYQIMRYLEQHAEETHRSAQAQMELTKSLDGNVKILINRLK